MAEALRTGLKEGVLDLGGRDLGEAISFGVRAMPAAVITLLPLNEPSLAMTSLPGRAKAEVTAPEEKNAGFVQRSGEMCGG